MINYLQVENLTKSYGDLVLFDNISFTIGEGQRIALIGRNGSGKTTLLIILEGKIRPTAERSRPAVTCVSLIWNKTRNMLRI